MATAQQFEDLGVWQDARELVNEIYRSSKQRAFYRDFSLRDQIRRASISTMSNIAEGLERGTRKEFIQFLNIAKGSNGEVRSQVYIALDQEYLDQGTFDLLKQSTLTLSRRLSRFISYLDSCSSNSRRKKGR